MSSPGRSDLLVYNGEIFNFAELATQRRLNANSDTRLLLNILVAGDASGLGDLRGMFAFVYWDPATRTITAARDRYGIKPLFVLEHPNGALSFASELKPLMDHPDSRTIDPVGLVHFLAEGHTGQTKTLFRNIRKLEPGTYSRWHLDLAGRAIQTSAETLAQGTWAELSVGEALVDSVRAHLVADVEVGVFLSGGLDSTLLAALASREHTGMRAFTLGFPDSPGHDETEIARHNAELMGLRHTIVDVRVKDMVEASTQIISATGEPLGDPAILPLSVLARTAREQVPVVLAGEGADELFGGYRRYQIDAWASRAPSIIPAKFLNAFGRRRGTANHLRSLEALLWGAHRGFRAHSALLLGEYPVLLAAAPYEAREALAARVAAWQRLTPTLGSRALSYDRSIWLPNTYLEKTDRATMLHGLEARVPYLDPIVERSIRPSDIRGQSKAPLRALLAEVLPDYRLPEVKKGLSVDTAALLRLGLAGPLNCELASPDSVVATVLGRHAQAALARRVPTAPLLGYRIAQIGLWREEAEPLVT
jgi:asparagine synthase (glutamine-hydrolysing)